MKKLLQYYKHCDAFYTAYQACFDDDFAWGQRTEWYLVRKVLKNV